MDKTVPDIVTVLYWLIGPDKRLGDNTLYDKTLDWLISQLSLIGPLGVDVLLEKDGVMELLWRGVTLDQSRVAVVFIHFIGCLAASGDARTINLLLSVGSGTNRCHFGHHSSQLVDHHSNQDIVNHTSLFHYILEKSLSTDKVQAVASLEAITWAISGIKRHGTKRESGISNLDRTSKESLWKWVESHQESLLKTCLLTVVNGSMYAKNAGISLFCALVSQSSSYSSPTFNMLLDTVLIHHYIMGADDDVGSTITGALDRDLYGWVLQLALQLADKGGSGVLHWMIYCPLLGQSLRACLLQESLQLGYLAVKVLDVLTKVKPALPWSLILQSNSSSSASMNLIVVPNTNDHMRDRDQSALIELLVDMAIQATQQHAVRQLHHTIALAGILYSSGSSARIVSQFGLEYLHLVSIISCSHDNNHSEHTAEECIMELQRMLSSIMPDKTKIFPTQIQMSEVWGSEHQGDGIVQEVLRVLANQAPHFLLQVGQEEKGSTLTDQWFFSTLLWCLSPEKSATTMRLAVYALKSFINAELLSNQSKITTTIFPVLLRLLAAPPGQLSPPNIKVVGDALIDALVNGHCRSLLWENDAPSRVAIELEETLIAMLLDRHWEIRDLAIECVANIFEVLAKDMVMASGRSEASMYSTPLYKTLLRSGLLACVWDRCGDSEGYLRSRVIDCLCSATVNHSPAFRFSQLQTISGGPRVIIKTLSEYLVKDGEALVRRSILTLFNHWLVTLDMVEWMLDEEILGIGAAQERAVAEKAEGNPLDNVNSLVGKDDLSRTGSENDLPDVERVLDEIVGFDNNTIDVETDCSTSDGGSQYTDSDGEGRACGLKRRRKRAEGSLPLYISYMTNRSEEGIAKDDDRVVGTPSSDHGQFSLISSIYKAANDLNSDVRVKSIQLLANLFLGGRCLGVNSGELTLNSEQQRKMSEAFYWMDGDKIFMEFANLERPVRLEACHWLQIMHIRQQKGVEITKRFGDRDLIFNDWLDKSVERMQVVLDQETHQRRTERHPLLVFGLADNCIPQHIPDCYN